MANKASNSDTPPPAEAGSGADERPEGTLPEGLERLGELSKDELIAYVRRQHEAGVRITFSGKQNARRIARRVQPRVSRTIAKYSVGDEQHQARNVLVEGENLQAMATLYRERGQVDLIITDPPYNTGNDFRYNDKWDEDPNDPDLGDLVPETDGARHTKWMKFMWPRLQMMKDMLKPSGVLAICIDHRELFRLGQMLDELFDERSGAKRLGIINWQKSYAPRNDNEHLSTATEYILVYAKSEERVRTGLLDRSESANSRYGNPDNDPDGDWREHDLTAKTPSAKNQYGIQSPLTGKVYYPSGTRSWTHPKRNIKKWLEEWGAKYEERDIDDDRAPALMVVGGNLDSVPPKVEKAARKVQARGDWPFVWFGLEGTGGPRVKKYLAKVRKGIVPMTYWADDDYDSPLEIGCTSWDHEESGRSQTGIKELNAIVGSGHGFDTVKPLQLFMKIIQLWCPSDGLVMDPFAGSGTTGHAVLALNEVAESNRRFIMIEQGRPENGDPYARSLCADRLRRVVEGNWANGKGTPLAGGYRFVSLQKRVDAKALLEMARDEMADAVIASYFDDSRRGPNLINMVHEGFDYLVARNTDNEGFFLVWNGSSKAPVFDEAVYDAVVDEARKAGLGPTYHVYARFNLYQSEDVKFYQIPNRILMDFGVSTSTDAFHEDESVVPVELD